MALRPLTQKEIQDRLAADTEQEGDTVLNLEDVVDEVDEAAVKALTFGNRAAFLPNAEGMTDEERMDAVGFGDPDKEILRHTDLIVEQDPARLTRVPALARLGQAVQLVGGHPSFPEYLRPDGVDEVWAVNARGHLWPEDSPPDYIISRDWVYLTGILEGDPNPPQYGVETLKKFPNVPVIVTADIGSAIKRCLDGESTMPCPEWFKGREWYELPLQNMFDTQFADLSGFSIGAGLAVVRHVRAKVVLTGVVCHRSDEEWAVVEARGGKPVDKQKLEDAHIAHEVREWLNKYGGKCVWTHGPTVPGSVAPVWEGSTR